MHAMKVPNSKVVGALFLMLFAATTHARIHVQVINQLGAGRRLSVHCRSKEDDIHHQILEAGEAIEWSFNLNLLGTTLFYCDVQWDNSKWYHFDAYDAKRDYRRCTFCRWMIAKDELLYGYNENRGFWKTYTLIPSSA